MSKVKYRFNTKSLTYEKVKVTFRDRFWRFTSYLAIGLVFATGTVLLAYKFIDSPKEKMLKREIEALQLQYNLLHKKMDQTELVLKDMQDRDDNIYRVIFEAEPIPNTIRQAGFGGSDRYSVFDNFDNAALLKSTTERLDKITKQLYIQSRSFDEVVKLAKNKELLISSIPAIMPINNKDLRKQPGGFGWRTHPIYKTPEFHPGMDFAAEQGTPIYATGDGVVEEADGSLQGYGNHVVINHGFGYQTLYGHMSKIAVSVGKKIKRGELVGYVGSTGLSTAPHVHYEVMKNGEKVNPINFYFNDLTPQQYQVMLEMSTKSTQSFD
ncbi:MAG TPA: M23 family metallopeptidase [Bacteroidia bacterium]|jgi:murein DD-endopeptidase MepM/ murein hydrolase activator NlpD|nr:M23 family metallopeptidase [Bacteroidia bacterium]